MKFKGLVFDFNGTLVWDTPYHNQAFDIFLEKHNIQLSDQEKTIKIHGKTNPDIMRGLFNRELDDGEITKFSIEKETIYQNLVKEDLHFASGVENLFNFLKLKNIPFCIATSSDLFNVKFYFRQLQLHRWFSDDHVIYNDGTLKGKPEPDIFLRAASILQLSPRELVIFEDSKAGVVAAENAGAGKIYIVNSINDNFSGFNYELITSFDEVDRNLF